MPTPHGIISFVWEKTDGKLMLEVTLPENSDIPCEVILPDGTTRTQTQTKASYTCEL